MKVRKILVPVDFSKFSEAALARAVDLTEQFSASLHLVHVVAEQANEDIHRQAMEKLGRALEPHQEMKLDVRRDVLSGPAHQSIVEYARQNNIDCIVMGTRGRTGLAYMALGSVAERVLRNSHVPVLVVKPDSCEDKPQSQQAANILHDEFGGELSGRRNVTHAQLVSRLVRVMDISQVQAEQWIGQLESSGALRWSASTQSDPQNGESPEGVWRIDPALLEQPKDDAIAVEPIAIKDSAALDIIQRALAVRATDVHIDPADKGNFTVRFRIDGQLEEYCEMSGDVAEHLITQLKTLAHLDIADPFHPKEGRLHLPESVTNLEVRITTSPVAGGQATALRLFSRDNVFFPLESLGFCNDALSAAEAMLRSNEGIILVTGPTGSGKTTTVYSMLEFLRKGGKNIVSIEDPVEFPVSFVRQVSVDTRHDLTMTSGLRTLLRMDPDIIFVGEIRDAETAGIAMRAASSGRHVLSTLHTRDVAATLTALRDLKVDNRSLAGNLTGIINQRLVRRLCPHCRESVLTSDSQREVFQEHNMQAPTALHQAPGCDSCRGTGYHGRIGIFEWLLVDDSMARAIAEGASEDELRQLIRSAGVRSISEDALQKASDGQTSFLEAKNLRWD